MAKQRLSLSSSVSVSTRQKITRALAGGAAVLAAVVAVVVLSPRGGRGRMPGYEWRSALYVDSLLVAGNQHLPDFPLLVRISSADLKSVAFGGKVRHPLGYDVRFTRGDGATPLFHTLENYNPEAGEYQAWVSVDTLYAQRKTPLYMYFGNNQVKVPVAPPSSSHGLRGFNISVAKDAPRPQIAASVVPYWTETEKKNQKQPDAWLTVTKPEHIQEPLPVEFEYIGAKLKGGAFVVVEWTTRKEFENDVFVVERSSDGRKFEPMGERGGSIRSFDLLPYSFPDPAPFTGTTFYRIKQVDKDQDYSYSDVVEVVYNPNLKGLQVKQVSADVQRQAIKVEVSTDITEAVRIELFDMEGNTLAHESLSLEPGTHIHYLPGWNTLKPGTYVVGVMGQDRKLKTTTVQKP
ncbi:MAG: DUF2341 domain-containing protein [Bacteroidia bacterium]|nr:DUF2341 domain-containing protein [Bacteroidia bacterium]